jgi:hypothetical protein
MVLVGCICIIALCPVQAQADQAQTNPPLLYGYVQAYDGTYETIERCYDTHVAEALRLAIRQFIKDCPLSKSAKDFFYEQTHRIDKTFSELWSREGHPPKTWRDSPVRCDTRNEKAAAQLDEYSKQLDKFLNGEISAAEVLGNPLLCNNLLQHQEDH